MVGNFWFFVYLHSFFETIFVQSSEILSLYRYDVSTMLHISRTSGSMLYYSKNHASTPMKMWY